VGVFGGIASERTGLCVEMWRDGVVKLAAGNRILDMMAVN
jgi:hypothetical protein